MAYAIKLRPGALDDLKNQHDIRSDAELARRLDISYPMLCQLRSGRRGVGVAFIAGATKAFGVPLNDEPGSIYQITGGPEDEQ